EGFPSRLFLMPARPRRKRSIDSRICIDPLAMEQDPMLVWACIAPHGSEFIPELRFANRERMRCTGAAMEELGRRCRAAKPDTLVVYTPHWVNVDDHYTVSIMANGVGTLE